MEAITTPDGRLNKSQTYTSSIPQAVPENVGAGAGRTDFGTADHSHAAFVADERYLLERAYLERGQQWLEDEYGQHITLDVSDRWRSPVRGDKRDYKSREYQDKQGLPRLYIVIHHFRDGNTKFDDYAVFDELYRDWLERKRALTAEERAAWEARRAEREQRAAQAAQACAERAAQARLKAEADERRRDDNITADRAVWERLPERGRSAYLVRKELPHVAPYRYERQTLVLPMWSATGAFAGVQRIKGDGGKRFTDGARKGGAFTVLGGPVELEGRIDLHNLPSYIAEGAATAAASHLSSGEPVICAYDAHNIIEVVRAIVAALDESGLHKKRRAWQRRLVVCADTDHYNAQKLHNGVRLGNVGLEAAHQVALEFGCRVACPNFSGLSHRDNPTDFYDLWHLAGADVVRAQLEAATLADPNIALAKRKRLYLRDHAARGGTFDRHIRLDDLPDGATVVQSPHNTRKTSALVPLIEQWRAEGRRVLYITHRVSLAGDAARRLRLERYDDYAASDLRLISGLAITTNSLPKLEDEQGNLDRWDVVILDESEQLIPSLTGSHVADKRGTMRVLSRLIGRARKVVCLDADAGELTRWALKTWRGGERINWIRNHTDAGAGKVARIYPHRAQVYAQLGTGTYAATDSLAESRRMAFTLRAQGVKTQLINGETSHDPDNLVFVADINRHAPTVEAVVASPSISTGVSLTDPGYTDAVGVFFGGNGPASEAVQSMWRARRADDWHLWLQPGGHGGDSIDLEARYGVALDAELARVGNPAHLIRNEDFGYGDLKQLVAERDQWARRTYRDDSIWLMVKQGVTVQLMDAPTDDEAPALRDLLKEACERERETYADERLSAEHLDGRGAEALREQGNLTSYQRFAVERYEHVTYFADGDTPNLKTWLLADYRGRYRAQLERLERTLQDDDSAQTYAAQLLDKVEMPSDAPLTLTWRDFARRVLAAVGFEGAVAALHEALTPDELDAAARYELETRANGRGDEPPEIAERLRAVALERFSRYTLDSEAVRELLAWIEASRPVLVGVVALPMPEKLAANAVRYIASWLKPLGLRQARAGKNERGEYVLEGASLALAAHVFERRGAGTLLLKTTLSTKSVPTSEAVPDGTSPPDLEFSDDSERLHHLLKVSHFRDGRPPAERQDIEHRLANADMQRQVPDVLGAS